MNDYPKKHKFLDFLNRIGEAADFVNTDYLNLTNLSKPPLNFESKYNTGWDKNDFD